MTDHKPSVFRFGSFEVKEREFLLTKGGEAVSVEPKAFRVLLFLLRNSGRLVKKDEILNAVWDDCSVSDNSLTRSIATLRRLLGDDPRDPRYIATVQTIGYRFLCAVEAIDDRVEKPEIPTLEIHDESKHVAAGQHSDPIAKHSPRIGRIVIGGIVLAAGLGFVWLIREPLFSRRQITEQQITRNSSDNPVVHAAISGDGKYLAFSDSLGIHVRLLATGETRDIAQPAQFHDALVIWRIHWLPDSTRFLADSVPIGKPPTIWQASVIGGALQEVREDALAMSVSPDGSTVAFVHARNRELWLMGTHGEDPRKLDNAGDHGNYWNVVWSPDSTRLLYIRNDWSGADLRVSLESRDVRGGPPVTLLADPKIRTVYWLPDGRILYALGEPDLNGDTCNFWAARVEPKTGQFAAKPTQLTHNTGFCLESVSATSDGKQIVFLKRSEEYGVYVADLARDASRISPPKHLSTTEGQEFPSTWTVDSQAIIIVSNRDRTWGFYRQPLNGGPATPILTDIYSNGLGAIFPHVSPDGKWLLYAAYPKNWMRQAYVDVLKVSITGGAPQLILKDRIFDVVRCAQLPATMCAIATLPDKSHLDFTSFDPMLGRGHQLARIEIDPNSDYTWALSPDATRIAVLKRATGEIHVLSIKTSEDHKITVQHWNNLLSLDWVADGKGLFTSSLQPSAVLLHVDLQGHADVLWEPKGTKMPWAIPSPDGRHITMPGFAENSNVWMMQDF